AEMSAADLRSFTTSARETNLLGLLPLLDGALCRLALLADAEVNGRPAVGVRVSGSKQQDMDLYFDRTSHFLVMDKRPAIGAGPAAQVLSDVYSDWKEMNGVQVPTRIARSVNGRKSAEFEVLQFMLTARVEAAEFAKRADVELDAQSSYHQACLEAARG